MVMASSCHGGSRCDLCHTHAEAAHRRAWPASGSFPEIQQNHSKVLSTLIIPRVLGDWLEKTRAWRAPDLDLKLIIISAVA
jgi:hypothetical protein